MSRVAVICPVFNEERDILEVVQRLREQTFTDWYVVFADGRSTDRTREILAELSSEDDRIRVVDNPRRLQSAGLNAALQAVDAELVIRIDGHSLLEPDYLGRIVQWLDDPRGLAVVGGRMVPRPVTGWVPEGVALANRSSWGAGPARFHSGGEPGPVDTVYLGAFRRQWLEDVGGWAENIAVNEDYELNYRIRNAGGVVWLDPSIEVGYVPRHTFHTLARQYYRYGKGKLLVLRTHPASARMRQVLPALGAPVLMLLVGLSFVLRSPVVVAAPLALHLLLLAVLAGRSAPRLTVSAALAAFVMHWTWSFGFWFGFWRPVTAPSVAGTAAQESPAQRPVLNDPAPTNPAPTNPAPKESVA